MSNPLESLKDEVLLSFINAKVDRRNVLKGGLGACAIAFLGSCYPKAMVPEKKNIIQKIVPTNFKRVSAVIDQNFDDVVVPEGYKAKVFFSWGDPVTNDAPEWKPDASQSWEVQQKQAGQNHDGMHFFSINGKDDHGLLVLNHEYVNLLHLHTNGPSGFDSKGNLIGKRPLSEVKKEQASHGVSIIEVKKEKDEWNIIRSSKYARRIHGNTPISITGPLKGHDKLKTKADPKAETVLGTFNNCAMGYTPWGTYLTCEENHYKYFSNPDKKNIPVEHSRYGISPKTEYGWETSDTRFDARRDESEPNLGFHNEPNRFGWVVEIDPFSPESMPKKRTAMGRLIRECATLSLSSSGKMAFYMSDDSRGEYVYKFVPKGTFNPNHRESNMDLLDEGKLFVAQMDGSGQGKWIEIALGKNGLTPLNGFKDEAAVLLNTRGSADHVGGTTMDRPEWIAVDPNNKDVYVSLSNNKKRGVNKNDPRQDLNKANPRVNNLHGHIIKIIEEDSDPTALQFKWEVFLFAGDPLSPKENLKGTISGDIFSSPDGLWFDNHGRLWVQTDYSDNIKEEPHMLNFGLNQMLAIDPKSRHVKRFFVGPKGCEVTGVTSNESGTAMFVNVQHPKLHFPNKNKKGRPRSSTILITKLDGGIIGS